MTAQRFPLARESEGWSGLDPDEVEPGPGERLYIASVGSAWGEPGWTEIPGVRSVTVRQDERTRPS